MSYSTFPHFLVSYLSENRMKLYSYNHQDKKLNYKLEGPLDCPQVPGALMHVLTFTSPYHSGNPLNDRAYCELFSAEPLDHRAKLLIFLHGFSTQKTKMQNYYYFIKEAVKRGYSCAFLNLPLHLNRSEDQSGSSRDLIYYDDVDTLKYFHQCVVDIKRLMDIAELEKWPLGSIHICGLSMGSMISVLAMAHDQRIEKGILLIGGGHWEQIHWKGILRFILKGDCADDGRISRDKCHHYYSTFPAFLQKLKQANPDHIDTKDLDWLSPDLSKMCFLCDPLAFAHRIGPERVLMINAKYDLYFSRKSTLMLHRQLGYPQIHWLAAFHSSRVLTQSKVLDKIFEFLK